MHTDHQNQEVSGDLPETILMFSALAALAIIAFGSLIPNLCYAASRVHAIEDFKAQWGGLEFAAHQPTSMQIGGGKCNSADHQN